MAAPPLLSITKQHLHLPFDEALTKLPYELKPPIDNHLADVTEFMSQIDQLHKPDDGGNNNITALSVLNYLHRILEPVTYIITDDDVSLSDQADQLLNITGNISLEIAQKTLNGVDDNSKITLAVFNILQQYSWEAKVALALTTYLMTCGDNGKGLNLCVDSNMSISKLPGYAIDVLKIISILVEFEKLPTKFITSNDQILKIARTHYIYILYWIIRFTVDFSIFKITSFSEDCFSPLHTRFVKDYLSTFGSFLKDTLHEEVYEFLVEKEDSEAYKKIIEIVHQDTHNTNMKLLNALFSKYDDAMPHLYDCLLMKTVHLNKLEGTYVLLLVSGLEIDKELHMIDMIYTESNQKAPYELVWVPIVDRKLKQDSAMKSKFEALRTIVTWYSFEHLSMIQRATAKFFRDDCHFVSDPIIVAMDPQGVIVSKNVFPMMLIWGNSAFPFTSVREKTLWEQETWRLELLFDNNGSIIEPKVLDWIRGDKHMFVYGGKNIEWLQRFRRMVNKIARKLQVSVEMIYVGRISSQVMKEMRVEMMSECFMREKLGQCLIDPMMTWYFWRRIESMIESMKQHMKINVIFQEIQKLLNYEKSNVGWAILAKGSQIMVTGHGDVALTTLEEFIVWKDNALLSQEQGFGVAFQNHYQKIYRKKFPSERIEIKTNSVHKVPDIPNEAMICTECLQQMQNYITFICHHPSSN